MDGNNRWAKQRGMAGVAGHKVGVERIRDVMTACQELDVEVLTLFAFSSENWRRPPREVEALMSLFLLYLKQERRNSDINASTRSEEHTSELQSRGHLVCRLLLEKKKEKKKHNQRIHTSHNYNQH